jgi:drug/metabolite transporter (DMT)-like permease
MISYALLAASMALVGSYVALSRPLVLVLPVFLLAWLRFGIGGLATLHWLKRPANELPMSAQTRKFLFLESFFGNFLFSICMLNGMRMTTAVSAGVIMAAIPAVVAALSRVFLKEDIKPRTWAAIACSVLGIGLLSLSKKELPTQDLQALASDWMPSSALVGNALVFGAVVCEAAYAVIAKKLTGALSPRRITALINLWGLALMTPFGIYAAWSFDFGSVHAGSWLLLVCYALAASVWTVWLWMSGLKNVPASSAGVFTVMLPISATLVGVLVLGEPMTPLHWVAFGIALLGVLLATLPGKAQATS